MAIAAGSARPVVSIGDPVDPSLIQRINEDGHALVHTEKGESTLMALQHILDELKMTNALLQGILQ